MSARLRASFKDGPDPAAAPAVPMYYTAVAQRIGGMTLYAVCACGAERALASGHTARQVVGTPVADEAAAKAGWRGGECPACAGKKVSERR